MRSHFHLPAAVFSVAALCLIAGCRVGPKYNVPPTAAQTAPPAYKEVPSAANAGPEIIKTDISTVNPPVVPAPAYEGWKIAQPQDAMLHGKWWEIFNEPDLNALDNKFGLGLISRKKNLRRLMF